MTNLNVAIIGKQSVKKIDWLIDWLIEWCLTPFQQYFRYVMEASVTIHAFLEFF